MRLFSAMDLVNALEQERAQGMAGRIAGTLLRLELSRHGGSEFNRRAQACT